MWLCSVKGLSMSIYCKMFVKSFYVQLFLGLPRKPCKLWATLLSAKIFNTRSNHCNVSKEERFSQISSTQPDCCERNWKIIQAWMGYEPVTWLQCPWIMNIHNCENFSSLWSSVCSAHTFSYTFSCTESTLLSVVSKNYNTGAWVINISVNIESCKQICRLQCLTLLSVNSDRLWRWDPWLYHTSYNSYQCDRVVQWCD